MEGRQTLAALYQLRCELARKHPYWGDEILLKDVINLLQEKIVQPQERPKIVITTSQWLGAISFACSIAAVYYKHKERKKLFEALSD